MELKLLSQLFCVCSLSELPLYDPNIPFYFFSKTDEEISLVCPSDFAPNQYIEKEDGWRGFRIQGALDFSLIGILSSIATILAEEKISIFAVSTYRTDYIFIKENHLSQAVLALKKKGYVIENESAQ